MRERNLLDTKESFGWYDLDKWAKQFIIISSGSDDERFVSLFAIGTNSYKVGAKLDRDFAWGVSSSYLLILVN